jgi:flagellar biosynthetic protein FliQ
MHEAVLFDAMRQALWAAVLVSTPLLAVALMVGVVVGLFQALTSVQEMTLTFVPKVGVMLVVFWVSMSFMSDTLVSLLRDMLVPLVVRL